MSQGPNTSAATAREFDIGDVVSLKADDCLLNVTGVIHDSERLFVTAPGDMKEREVKFSEVGEQYVLKATGAQDDAAALRAQRDELMTAAQALIAFIEGRPDAVEPFGIVRTAIARVTGGAAPATSAQPLTDEQIEAGRKATFSTDNPFCPCDSKTMRKAVRWAERAHGITGGAA
jgi:hypothetical protein